MRVATVEFVRSGIYFVMTFVLGCPFTVTGGPHCVIYLRNELASQAGQRVHESM